MTTATRKVKTRKTRIKTVKHHQRRQPKMQPLPGFTAAEKRCQFRLDGPFYSFDYARGPTVLEWDGEEHCVVFRGDPEQCLLYLDYRNTVNNA